MLGAHASRTRPLILVIDDNPDLLALFHDVLTDECDYVVNAQPDQVPSLDEIRTIAPDVLIIDHRLTGGVQGWDMIVALRNTVDLCRLPIVFCTADLQYLEQVADDLVTLQVTPLVKPFGVDQLVDDVAQALVTCGLDPSPCP